MSRDARSPLLGRDFDSRLPPDALGLSSSLPACRELRPTGSCRVFEPVAELQTLGMLPR